VRDEIADTINLALRTIECIMRVYARIPEHRDLVRTLATIFALLIDLRDTFAPV